MIHPLQGTVDLISHQFNNATVDDYDNISNPEENKGKKKCFKPFHPPES